MQRLCTRGLSAASANARLSDGAPKNGRGHISQHGHPLDSAGIDYLLMRTVSRDVYKRQMLNRFVNELVL